jgi:hypothetical protein
MSRLTGASLARELPLLSVLGLLAVGLACAAYLERWRLGSLLMGLALCGAAALRLTLPPRQAGLLVVRSKVIDATVLLVLGFGLVVLGNTIPTGLH